MLFKKKISVEDYCRSNLTPLLSKERELTWEAMRRTCNDSQLNGVEAQLYYKHLRAVFIQLMLISLAKNCNIYVSSDAHVFMMLLLKEHNLSDIDAICMEYSEAFASSTTDGVLQMVLHFSERLTASRMHEKTIETLYAEFYGILRLFFNDFKSIKLVNSK